MNSPADPGQKLDLLSRELAEAREQQAAIGDILRVISNSPGDVTPVFETVARHAARICEAPFADIIVVEAGMIRGAANVGELGPHLPGHAIALDRTTFMGRSICDKQTLHVADLQSPELDFPLGRKLAIEAGARTALAVPLIRDDRALGTILVRRTEVRPFEDKHIALLKTFADQAAIAIENARLLHELRQRTDDLSEALEQQTATSEVLNAISASPGELEPIFNTLLENAIRICAAQFGSMYLYSDGSLNVAAMHDAPPAFAHARRAGPVRPGPDAALGRLIATKTTVHVADMQAERAYIDRDPVAVAAVELGGIRTVVMVPMIKDDELVGLIAIYRQHVAPFSDKQIALLQNFAAQAVIAIENARLLTELRESLQQQTATADVLKVISRSTFDLKSVLDTLVESAARLCEADMAAMSRPKGGAFEHLTSYGYSAEHSAYMNTHPIPADRGSVSGRVLLEGKAVHIADIRADPDYTLADRDKFNVRTMLGVPLMREGAAIGVIVLQRSTIRPFTDKQIELVTTFANQAVIAIENARLLNEVRQQASQLEAQSKELRALNQQLEQRVDEQVGEIERMGRLRRFLPPQVADLIVSSGSEKQLESHRREITALFCDLRGFTGFSETSDPEDVMALLREYHKAIGEIIFRHGGTLERFAGDGVMVIFNDPVPLPNPALSAVQMALEMRAAIGALIDKWRRLGHELGFGIGISHGYATLGTIGFEGRFDYAAIGTVSNVASRLCDEAQPGQILVSPRVLLAVEDSVAVEPVREMALKGIRRPMPVHNVIGTRERA